MIWVAIAVAGGLGAVCRFGLDRAISAHRSRRLASGPLPMGALPGPLPSRTSHWRNAPWRNAPWRNARWGAFPWGTFWVNVSGSLLAGVLTGLVSTRALPPEVQTVAVGGFLGGYTTFSTAMYESLRLIEDGEGGLGLVNTVLPLLASVLAAGLGLWLAS